MNYTTFRIFVRVFYLILTIIAFIRGTKRVKASLKKLKEHRDEQEKRKAPDEPEFKNR